MAQQFFKFNFHVAVSDKRENKLGSGGNVQLQERRVYYYAEKSDNKKLFIQPLNSNNYPSGEKRDITFDAFIKNFRPEPLFYYNKVKPVMDAVNKGLTTAERHLENDRLDKAERTYKNVLAVDSDNIRAIFGLGITYLVAANHEDAQHVFSKIMSLDLAFGQEHTHLFNKFGIQMRKSGMLSHAADYYEKAIALNPDDEHLLFNLSRVLFEQCEYEQSYEHIRKALTLNAGFNEGLLMKRALDRATGGMICPGIIDSPIESATDTPVESIIDGILGSLSQEAPATPAQRDYSGLDLEGAPWEM